MRKLLLAIVILVTLGCENNLQPNELRFNSVNNLPVVSLKLNGKYGRFLVDTGASQSTLDMTTADKYDFNVGSSDETISGVGGSTGLYRVSNVNVTYRDSTLNIPFKSADLSAVRKAIGVTGIIGSDWMNRYNVKIDYETNTIILK